MYTLDGIAVAFADKKDISWQDGLFYQLVFQEHFKIIAWILNRMVTHGISVATDRHYKIFMLKFPWALLLTNITLNMRGRNGILILNND